MEGKFWLISDKDVNEIRAALETESSHTYTTGHNENNCKGCNELHQRFHALHALDSGLHLTDEQPTG